MDKIKKLIIENKYVLLLLYWPAYLIAFFAIDRIETDHYVITCALDSFIGFNEYFVIAYALWFLWFPGWCFHFLFYALKPWLIKENIIKSQGVSDTKEQNEALKARSDFIKLCIVMFTSMTLSLIIYVLFPNAVDLREPVESDNICAAAVRLIRLADTPYGVCPSIHIATITAEMLVIKDSTHSSLSGLHKTAALIVTLLITYSTMAIKQHSVVDVAAGALLAAAIYAIYNYIYEEKL